VLGAGFSAVFRSDAAGDCFFDLGFSATALGFVVEGGASALLVPLIKAAVITAAAAAVFAILFELIRSLLYRRSSSKVLPILFSALFREYDKKF